MFITSRISAAFTACAKNVPIKKKEKTAITPNDFLTPQDGNYRCPETSVLN